MKLDPDHQEKLVGSRRSLWVFVHFWKWNQRLIKQSFHCRWVAIRVINRHLWCINKGKVHACSHCAWISANGSTSRVHNSSNYGGRWRLLQSINQRPKYSWEANAKSNTSIWGEQKPLKLIFHEMYRHHLICETLFVSWKTQTRFQGYTVSLFLQEQWNNITQHSGVLDNWKIIHHLVRTKRLSVQFVWIS